MSIVRRIRMAKTKAHENAESALSAELRDTFNALVQDYMDASERHTADHSRRVNYNILSDLVRAGWKKSNSN